MTFEIIQTKFLFNYFKNSQIKSDVSRKFNFQADLGDSLKIHWSKNKTQLKQFPYTYFYRHFPIIIIPISRCGQVENFAHVWIYIDIIKSYHHSFLTSTSWITVFFYIFYCCSMRSWEIKIIFSELISQIADIRLLSWAN